MKPTTIVTACTGDYLKKLRWSLPSWTIKPEFRICPLIVFYHDMRERDLTWVKDVWPSEVRLIKWDMPKYDNTRELMLSAFVLGAAEHVDTDYFVKLDADAFCTSKARVFTDSHYELDLCSHPWGYTKPGWMIDHLKAWSVGEKYPTPGSSFVIDTGPRKDKRIISFCCLHRTGFVREAAKLAKGRLPVPSHDTFLWFLAENVTEFSWGTVNVKKRGVDHTGRVKSIREGVCSTDGAWNKYHMDQLMRNMQLEVTSYCNLKCVNCDRACGQAPTKDQMSLGQVDLFVNEALAMRAALGIDLGRIDIIGGEPTLHPEIVKICQLVYKYKQAVPSCKVRLSTNGSGSKVRGVLAELEQFDWLKVRDSSKDEGQGTFELVNCAPIDEGVNPAKACSIPWRCGLGVNSHGYYLCGAGAGIARVFGIRCAIPSMADLVPQLLHGQKQTLCTLCGHSRSTVRTGDKQETSPAWQEAFDRYKVKGQADLEVYGG